MRLRPPGGGTRPPDARPPAEEKFVSVRQGPRRQLGAQKKGPRQGMLNMSDTPEINVGPRADGTGRYYARNRVKNVARRPALANIDEDFAYSGEEDDDVWIQEKPRPRRKLNGDVPPRPRVQNHAVVSAIATVPEMDRCAEHPGESTSVADEEDWERCDTSSMASWERCDTSSMASWDRCETSSMASSSWMDVGGEDSDEAPERHHDCQSECSDASFLLVDADFEEQEEASMMALRAAV